MKRFSRSLALAAVALGAMAASLLAGQPGGADRDMSGSGQALRRTEQCLSTLGLSADRKTAVQAILSNNKVSLRADVEAWKASQKKLQDDIARGAEKNVLGQDVLDQEASAAKVRGSSQALRTQILAALTPEQQTRFNECSDSRRGKGRYPNPPPSNPN
jgi:Spy/CpxP family protein refolding chaperone